MNILKLLNNSFLCMSEAGDPSVGGSGGGISAIPSLSADPVVQPAQPDQGGSGGETPEPGVDGAGGNNGGDGEYNVTWGETFSADDAMRKSLAEYGKKHGISAEALSSFCGELDAHFMSAEQARVADLAQRNEADWKQLMNEWGTTSQVRQERAALAYRNICEKAGIDVKALDQLGIAQSPLMFRLMDKVGELLGERGDTSKGGPASGVNISEAEKIISGGHDLHKAFYDPGHPDFKTARETYYKLMGN